MYLVRGQGGEESPPMKGKYNITLQTNKGKTRREEVNREGDGRESYAGNKGKDS